MKKLFLLTALPLFFSCATIDIESRTRDFTAVYTGGTEEQYAPDFSPAPAAAPEIIVVEKPVYVPASQSPPAQAARTGEQTARAANSEGILSPGDYSHAAVVYDYDRDWVYEVYAQPLRVCDITLQAGERVIDSPFISDSERWIIGAGVSYENGAHVQHIYIKPNSAGLDASLIINTDRRVYRIILRSFRDVFMPVVRWRYAPSVPSSYFPSGGNPSNDPSLPGGGVDPRFLSFNYRITYPLFQKPYWLPELVFDDGSKTYIQFPSLVLQREFPAVMENRSDVLNYRVSGSLVIIDKLIENITVKIGRTEITINKKRGG